jgi:riboflavin biosynthesis pyrimidine reductase
LPPELERLYGHFSLPESANRPNHPYIISNFVTTLDGVVALNDPAHPSGGDISGGNKHDRMVMGLLRAVADAVIVGAGTFRAVPRHLWTAEYIYPPLSETYRQLRTTLGKTDAPLNVIVSASGNLDLSRPVFQSGDVPALIVTTPHGAQRIASQSIPETVQISTIEHKEAITAKDILQAVQSVNNAQIILIEGGPQLMGDFLAEQCLDELFLTLAPQIAGRTDEIERPGLVVGKLFAPEHPLWGRLVSIRRGGSHVFLRYQFGRATASVAPTDDEEIENENA